MKPLPFYMKLIGCLFSVLLMTINSAFAEAVGDKNGYLQALSNETFEKQVHTRLIKQIKIENPQPFTAKEAHPHWGCRGREKHSHIGTRKHVHKYNCGRRVQLHSSPVRRAAPRLAAPMQKPQASTTNLQEAGVDEADFVKTDGRFIYAIASNQRAPSGVRIFDTNTGKKQPKQIGAIGFEKGLNLTGMYLVPRESKLIVIGSSYRNSLRERANHWSSETSIITVDISNKAKPKVIQQVKLEGNSRSTRRIANKLYMVISSNGLSYPSTYKYLETPKKLTAVQTSKEWEKIANTIKSWSVADAMPHYRVLGKSTVKALNNNNSTIMKAPGAENQYSLTTLLTIDLSAKGFEFEALHYLGYVGTIYASDKALYITQNASYAPHIKSLNKTRFPSSFPKQLVHKFSYKNKGVDYRGSGAVFGDFGWSQNTSFQLDEDRKGTLRVVSQNWRSNSTKFSDPATRSPVVLTALAEHPNRKQLVTLSRLPNPKRPKALGKKGESLYASRLFNDYAYFVTFRRTDPLYVVDLRNPRNMVVTGELEIPGFSDYLHPINSRLLMGIGKEADNVGRVEGLKLSLFDISNPRQPREVDKIQLGRRGTHSPANQNHHAFTSLKMREGPITRVSLPVHLVAKDSNSYRGKDGLHQFEVNARAQKIVHVGQLAPPKVKKQYWYWNSTDRSIIIDNKVYYYQNGNIWAGAWGGK